MDAVLQVVEESQKLDLLDRQEFVNRMLTIANVLSDNKKNACYAVNGDWGVGKSFVLDMFERQAQREHVEGEELPRYLIFRYNCWEYDYYEEPLVAIVASILDQIDKKENLLSADLKERIVALLKVIGKGLLKKAVHLIDDKTGVDLEKAVEVIKEGGEAAEEAIKESHEYDLYFDFKKNLKKLQKTMAFLSEEQTVIFVVDELDRCLPEYTIKVLERLHHLFEGMPNVQVILSIDAGQLEHVVRQIYGEATDAKKYLKKFIQFELKLSIGKLNSKFNDRFKEYTHKFEGLHSTTSIADVEEFNTTLLDGMDIRSRIAVIERSMLIHNIIAENSVIDYSFMSMELFLVVLNDGSIDMEMAKKRFRVERLFDAINIYGDSSIPVLQGLQNLTEHYKANVSRDGQQHLFSQTNGFSYVWNGDIWGVILGVYRDIIGFNTDSWNGPGNQYKSYYIGYGRKFWNALQIIS